MHGHLCVVCVVVVLFTYLLFFFLSLLFQTFQTPFSTVHKKFMSQSPRNFRLGTVVSNDHETPLTGYEPNRETNFVDTEELDLAATSDIYWQHTFDDTSRNDIDVDDNQLAKYLAVVVESTGKPVELRSLPVAARDSSQVRSSRTLSSSSPMRVRSQHETDSPEAYKWLPEHQGD